MNCVCTRPSKQALPVPGVAASCQTLAPAIIKTSATSLSWLTIFRSTTPQVPASAEGTSTPPTHSRTHSCSSLVTWCLYCSAYKACGTPRQHLIALCQCQNKLRHPRQPRLAGRLLLLKQQTPCRFSCPVSSALACHKSPRQQLTAPCQRQSEPHHPHRPRPEGHLPPPCPPSSALVSSASTSHGCKGPPPQPTWQSDTREGQGCLWKTGRVCGKVQYTLCTCAQAREDEQQACLSSRSASARNSNR